MPCPRRICVLHFSKLPCPVSVSVSIFVLLRLPVEDPWLPVDRASNPASKTEELPVVDSWPLVVNAKKTKLFQLFCTTFRGSFVFSLGFSLLLTTCCASCLFIFLVFSFSSLVVCLVYDRSTINDEFYTINGWLNLLAWSKS